VTDAPAGEKWILARAAEWSAQLGFWYGIWERPVRRLVGQLQLKNVDWELERAELAYLIDRDFEGRGLVTEAARALIEVGFERLGLRRIILRTLVENERSAALALRLGFKLEGTLRQDFRTGRGRWVDLHLFGLLAP
jgi:RimJ/RimL family protein N-acetyltransferase